MKLLIPGPVTTRPEVRAAMAQDYAPWDNEFRPIYISVCERLRDIAGGAADTHVCLALQGCGHFSTEAALRTFVPPGGRMLIPMVGAYADRMAKLAREAGREVVELPADHQLPLDSALVAAALAADPTISHVGMIYSETGSGVIHDPAALGAVVRAAGRRMIIDAVSAFGALPFDISAQPEVDAMVFTSNKCFEGMPGLGFCIARIDRLLASVGNAGGWSLDFTDVYAQTLRNPGAFRFTPPVQVLAAFAVALDIYAAEGGQKARLARYTANRDALYQGVVALGLQPYLGANLQGPIVMNVHAPADPAWNLQSFVDGLKARGYLISNFHDTPQPSFRVGLIGAITPEDMRGFVAAIDAVLPEMGVRQRRPARQAA